MKGKTKQGMDIHDSWEYSALMLRYVEALERIAEALERPEECPWCTRPYKKPIEVDDE